MNFNRYFDNDELDSLLAEWANHFPKLLELRSIGESFEGRPIHLLTITNQDTGRDDTKPALWFDANIHATEIAGTTTALRIAWELISTYESSPEMARRLDTTTFYIVPRLNPDGAQRAMATPPEFHRSGVRGYPYMDKADGLHQDDIDGDGRILQMRIPDPNGDWKVSALDARLMEKRGADETGEQYFRILPEGRVQGYDGYQIPIARRLQGMDFNRNYPAEWRPENEQRGAGPYPTSESEIRAAVEFIASHPNINTAVAFHTFSGVILRPYGNHADDTMDAHDLWTFEALGERTENLTGYKTVSVFHDFRYHPKMVITGPSNDWAYDHLGLLGYVVELWDIVGMAGIEDRKFIEWMRNHPHSDDLAILNLTLENVEGEPYVDWYAFDHPELGSVELGGYDMMYTWRNPPHAYMGAEADRNVPFALLLSDVLPRLAISQIDVEPIEPQLYRIRAAIDNTGFLPTFTTQQARKRGVARPIRVELELDEANALIQGQRISEIGHLEGRSNKMAVFSFGSAGTDNRALVEWTLRGSPGDTVFLRVLADRAGQIETQFQL